MLSRHDDPIAAIATAPADGLRQHPWAELSGGFDGAHIVNPHITACTAGSSGTAYANDTFAVPAASTATANGLSHNADRAGAGSANLADIGDRHFATLRTSRPCGTAPDTKRTNGAARRTATTTDGLGDDAMCSVTRSGDIAALHDRYGVCRAAASAVSAQGHSRADFHASGAAAACVPFATARKGGAMCVGCRKQAARGHRLPPHPT